MFFSSALCMCSCFFLEKCARVGIGSWHIRRIKFVQKWICSKVKINNRINWKRTLNRYCCENSGFLVRRTLYPFSAWISYHFACDVCILLMRWQNMSEWHTKQCYLCNDFMVLKSCKWVLMMTNRIKHIKTNKKNASIFNVLKIVVFCYFLTN